MSMVLLGGNGFLGRHIAIRAAAARREVTVVSREPDADFFAHHAAGTSMMEASAYAGSRGADLIAKASTIVYLINRSVPSTFFDEPESEVRNSLAPGLDDLVRIARLNPAALLIFLSSGGAVYGSGADSPIPESHPLRPISPYGFSKAASEQFLHFLGARYGQRYAILRVANAVGPWHRNTQQGLLPAVVRAIRQDAPIPLYGSGLQVRDYIDAEDVARAVLAVEGGAASADPVWNIGSGVGYTIRELIDQIAISIGRAPRLDHRPARPFDVEKSVLEIGKAARELGWRPTRTVAESVERASRYYMLEGS